MTTRYLSASIEEIEDAFASASSSLIFEFLQAVEDHPDRVPLDFQLLLKRLMDREPGESYLGALPRAFNACVNVEYGHQNSYLEQMKVQIPGFQNLAIAPVVTNDDLSNWRKLALSWVRPSRELVMRDAGEELGDELDFGMSFIERRDRNNTSPDLAVSAAIKVLAYANTEIAENYQALRSLAAKGCKPAIEALMKAIEEEAFLGEQKANIETLLSVDNKTAQERAERLKDTEILLEQGVLGKVILEIISPRPI